MKSLLDDISKITTLRRDGLEKLSEISADIIAHTCKDAKDSVLVNIGIGILGIYIDKDTISYKFSPSRALSKKISDAVDRGVDPLETLLEASLVKKIMGAYKDLV